MFFKENQRQCPHTQVMRLNKDVHKALGQESKYARLVGIVADSNLRLNVLKNLKEPVCISTKELTTRDEHVVTVLATTLQGASKHVFLLRMEALKGRNHGNQIAGAVMETVLARNSLFEILRIRQKHVTSVEQRWNVLCLQCSCETRVVRRPMILFEKRIAA